MIDLNINYGEMINYAAQAVCNCCDNINGKYNNLPIYVKSDYRLHGYLKKNILPTGQYLHGYKYQGGNPTVTWQILNSTAIPNNNSVDTSAIQVELSSQLNIDDLGKQLTTNDLIWFLNGVGQFCKGHLKFYRQLFNVNKSAIIPSPLNSVLPKANTYLAYLSVASTPIMPPATLSNEIEIASTVNDTLSSLMEVVKTYIPIENIQYRIIFGI